MIKGRERIWQLPKQGDAMKYWIATISGLLLCLSSAQAATQAATPLYTTAYLQSLCSSTYDIDAGLCSGYLMGVADSLQQAKQACLSPQIGPETLTSNIRRAWEQNPDQPRDALQSVQEILQARFPCP